MPLHADYHLRRYRRVTLHTSDWKWLYDPVTTDVLHCNNGKAVRYQESGDHRVGHYYRTNQIVEPIPKTAVPVDVDNMFDIIQLQSIQPCIPAPPQDTSPESFVEFVQSLPKTVQRLIGDWQVGLQPWDFTTTDDDLSLLATDVADGKFMLVSDGGVRDKRGAYAWKIVSIEPTDTRFADAIVNATATHREGFSDVTQHHSPSCWRPAGGSALSTSFISTHFGPRNLAKRSRSRRSSLAAVDFCRKCRRRRKQLGTAHRTTSSSHTKLIDD